MEKPPHHLHINIIVQYKGIFNYFEKNNGFNKNLSEYKEKLIKLCYNDKREREIYGKND